MICCGMYHLARSSPSWDLEVGKRKGRNRVEERGLWAAEVPLELAAYRMRDRSPLSRSTEAIGTLMARVLDQSALTVILDSSWKKDVVPPRGPCQGTCRYQRSNERNCGMGGGTRLYGR